MAGTLIGSAAGCGAASREAARPGQPIVGPAGEPGFEMDVYPFEVRDSAGNPYDHPLLGGFNVPRPQWMDIDGDGDLDLFVQERSGQVIFLESQGTSPAHRYVWRTDRFAGLDVGEWYRFADVDLDGDKDLLTERRFSHIRFFRNDGRADAPRFTLVADTVRDTAGKPVFSDRQNIPNVSDIDCDGLPDLFIGKLDGTVSRYEAAGSDGRLEPGQDGAPRFQLLADRFEDIEIVAQFGTLHGANTLVLTDVDDDGDEDLFWGDFFEPGLLFIENTGSCSRPVLSGQPRPFPPDDPLSTSGYNAPTFGDVDGDGDRDLLIGVLGGAYNPNLTSADNLVFLEQLADGRFEKTTDRYVSQIDVGSESIPALADLDGDGDLDLFLANKIDPDDLQSSRIYEFRNEGTGAAPSFRLHDPLEIRGLYHYAPAFADLDADGDLDLVLGSWKSHVAYYLNEGSPTAPRLVLADSAMVTLTRGSNSTPALADIDADGDLDLFVGEASGALNFYRNQGTPERHDFVLESDEFQGIDPGRRSYPVLVDADADGDLDLVMGTETGRLAFFRNQGTVQTPDFIAADEIDLDLQAFSAPAFSDLNDDGLVEMLVGGAGGGLRFYRIPRPDGQGNDGSRQ